ncbi:MAG TPA: VOC family protein [Euzebyales bacterium]
MLAIDHAIIAVNDPASWAARVRARAGLTAVPGGRHVGTGTGNWIVPLGDAYLELMTVVDDAEAQDSPLGRWVIEQTRHGDRLAALCLRTDAIDEIADRLGLTPEAMARRTEDDVELRWRLVGLDAALSGHQLPFFIQWDTDDGRHPGRMPAEHVNAPSGIPWIEFGGDQQRLARWLGEHALPIRCVEEPPGPRTVAVATAQRLVRITTTGIT